MALPHEPRTHALGHVIEIADVTIFFGNRESTPENLSTAFPDYNLARLNQTHSDIVIVHQPGLSPEGDAHCTNRRKVALCIRTADCLPVMIHDPESGWIAAIHAGWRGIENEIIVKTCTRLRELGATLKGAYAWIGPHIGVESFEVGRDVGAQLEARFDAVRGFVSKTTALVAHANSEKTYVDLLLIARAQLYSQGLTPETTKELAIDTFTSADHASYRRDPKSGGRQISFIALR